MLRILGSSLNLQLIYIYLGLFLLCTTLDNEGHNRSHEISFAQSSSVVSSKGFIVGAPVPQVPSVPQGPCPTFDAGIVPLPMYLDVDQYLISPQILKQRIHLKGIEATQWKLLREREIEPTNPSQR